jgi:hypothetical protein
MNSLLDRADPAPTPTVQRFHPQGRATTNDASAPARGGRTGRHHWTLIGILALAWLGSLAFGRTPAFTTALISTGLVLALFAPLRSSPRFLRWHGRLRATQRARSGVLHFAPATPRQALRVLPWWLAAFAASCLLLAAPRFAPNIIDHESALGAIWAGAWLSMVFAAGLVAMLLAIPVVHRHGRSPRAEVMVGYAFISALLIVDVGHLLLSALASFVPALAAISGDTSPLQWVPEILGLTAFVTLIAAHGISSGQRSHRSIQALEVGLAVHAKNLAESQLAMLQAQIEPHFLYNTLASVQQLVRKDAKAADYLLTQLIRYLRHAMPRLRATMSTLAQEFELADAYLQIARVRMGARLSVSVELQQSLHELPFPPLVLQTLVENALKHGVEPKVGAVAISVSAQRSQGGLEVIVEDNGVGLHASPATAGSGTGLANIRERLATIYGDQAQLRVDKLGSGGVRACVLLSAPRAGPSPARPPRGSSKVAGPHLPVSGESLPPEVCTGASASTLVPQPLAEPLKG